MPQIFPIGGGKGGSGKSFITANLGALIAKGGKKVVLVDLDLGGSNLHTLLGLHNPKTGLHDFLDKAFSDLAAAVVPTCIPNLYVITSSDCSMEIANLFYAQKLKIIRAIQRLPFDYILLDLGAGTNFNTLDFFLISNVGLFVVTPEPTSIENTFRFIKAAYYRKIKQILKQESIDPGEADNGEGVVETKHLQSPSDFIDLICRQNSEKGKILRQRLSELHLKFILNQCRKQTDSCLGDKIQKVCNRHFHSRFQFLENVTYDERVHDAISSKKVFIDIYPHTPTAVALRNIAEKVAGNGHLAAAKA
ncbi:MAG: P-loop NTPase [Deltaproteobacteria bacterium]|nr:P-loop NTPase [Deltaproteobacteria bacterium]MBW2016694.1 P-loop NTPase [Deltaproteobacteria bacterium]MBW2128071.1 P-loop NTPase [Deltaproteobacteria bacterium]MBW2304091.1 P-loop NTPase [Deltaproteobacteria bacterium]